MPMLNTLSDTQVDLIKRLIEFAEENHFFEFEFEGEGQEKRYRELWTVADRLYQDLSPAEKRGQEATAVRTRGAAMQDATTSENGRPWWDISSVRLGLKPAELRAQLERLRERLSTLMYFSDNLEVRQAILEAVCALKSTEEHLRIVVNKAANEEESI